MYKYICIHIHCMYIPSSTVAMIKKIYIYTYTNLSILYCDETWTWMTNKIARGVYSQSFGVWTQNSSPIRLGMVSPMMLIISLRGLVAPRAAAGCSEQSCQRIWSQQLDSLGEVQQNLTVSFTIQKINANPAKDMGLEDSFPLNNAFSRVYLNWKEGKPCWLRMGRATWTGVIDIMWA
jgi:hypothetical protein